MLLFAMIPLLACLVLSSPVYAAEEEDLSPLRAQAEERKRLPVQSNDTAGWPDGPAIGAEAAILMEANTGTILYAKNIHEKLYPASTTKILTCLLAVENGTLTDEVRFSEKAVLSLPPGSSSIGIDPGEAMPLETCLYGILVGSANEVSNAVGEYIGGSISAFVDMMNARADELGCVDSHFANTNGLPDETHVTSAHDLAVIACAFFDNPLLARISGTASYHFVATQKQKDDFVIRNKNKLVNGDMPYEGIVGGKTGYTDLARETLVSCAERNGMRLICVVMKEESPSQFSDTVTLFEYGFNNFRLASPAAEETRFLPNDTAFPVSSVDLFGDSSPALSFDKEAKVLLPAGISITDAETSLTYPGTPFAHIEYSWHGVPLGSADVFRRDLNPVSQPANAPGTVTVRLNEILPRIYIAAAVFCLLSVIITLARSYHFSSIGRAERRRFRRRKRENRREHIYFGDE